MAEPGLNFQRLQAFLRAVFPGLLVCGTIAAAASFLSGHYGGPPMLFAVLLGLALGFLRDVPRLQPGIELATRGILRLGVALLGLRITFADITALGVEAWVLVFAGVSTTIVFGVLASRALGLGRSFGALTGGSVAVCGVSAALAISAVLPHTPQSARDTSFAVIGVTALSTLAMILYPLVVAAVGFDDRHAGMFIGATIHDVAQVVAAGYSISAPAGDAATFTKLLRVALLLPIVLILTLIMRSRAERAGLHARPPILPLFLAAFAALIVLNSLVALPEAPKVALQQLAQVCLITAVAALGIRTSLQDLAAMGTRPVLLLVGETLYLALLAIVLLRFLP
jgi:uncharacterized integral membrane protein (TIGR00698 family)